MYVGVNYLPEAVPEGDVQCRYGVDITPALPEVTSRGVPINQSIEDAQDGVERRREEKREERREERIERRELRREEGKRVR